MESVRQLVDDHMHEIQVNCFHGTKRSTAGVLMGRAQLSGKVVSVRLRQAGSAVLFFYDLASNTILPFLDSTVARLLSVISSDMS
jgi:hypothetical protein